MAVEREVRLVLKLEHRNCTKNYAVVLIGLQGDDFGCYWS